MRIRTRFFLTFLVLAGLGFLPLTRSITEDLGPRYLAAMEESMVDMSTVLSSFLETRAQEGALDTSDLRAIFEIANRKEFSAKIYELTKDTFGLRVYVTDAKGIVLYDSADPTNEGKDFSRFNDVVLTLRGEYGARTTPHYRDDPEGATLYVASPVRIHGEIAGVLTLCKPAKSVSLFLATARRQIIGAGLLAALAVIVLGAAVSSWITNPIGLLTRYAIAVRDGRRAAPPHLGRSEIGRLGTAFEEMKERLEGKQYAENYVQALTHEMKSPLSAIRGAAELLGEEMPADQRARFLDNIRNESARIQDLVDRLLQLSALENRKELRDVEDLDLADLVHEVVESMEPVLCAARQSVQVTAGDASAAADDVAADDLGADVRGERVHAVGVHASACGDPVRVRGERFLVRQALANLLKNAAEFSPEGGNICVSVTLRDSLAEVRVRDEGPGVPDYALDKVFDRFYSLRRPGTGKKSSGLGLTFAREAARLHGGEVRLENAEGSGALVVLTLPCLPPTAGPAGAAIH